MYCCYWQVLTLVAAPNPMRWSLVAVPAPARLLWIEIECWIGRESSIGLRNSETYCLIRTLDKSCTHSIRQRRWYHLTWNQTQPCHHAWQYGTYTLSRTIIPPQLFYLYWHQRMQRLYLYHSIVTMEIRHVDSILYATCCLSRHWLGCTRFQTLLLCQLYFSLVIILKIKY